MMTFIFNENKMDTIFSINEAVIFQAIYSSIGSRKWSISSEASKYETCAYARWELPNEKFDGRIIAAKNRVAPIKKISLVRLEINAAVMSKRLCSFIKDETRKRSLLLTRKWSQLCCKESYGFNTYAANWIGEIQTSKNPNNWK